MAAPPQSRLVFISYSPEDRAWRERIAYSLEAAGLDVLEDMGTSPGRYWESVLQTMRESATALVLVITENFLKSPLVRKELADLRELQGTKQFRVFPVIAEPCSWHEIEQIKANQIFPPDGTPLSKKSDSEVLTDLQALAKEISGAVSGSPVVPQQAQPKRGDRVAPPIIAMSFGPTSVPINGTATLKFQITNPNERAGLTGIAFGYVLPDGLVVSSAPMVTNSCGGTITGSPGSNTFSLSGGLLNASASGAVTVSVTGKTPGVKVSSATVTSTQGGTGNTATATITVAEAGPADGLARKVAFRLSVKRPDGMYVAMASQISPALAVTPYHVIAESGILQDRTLQIELDFLILTGETRATVLATDEANDIALLQHAPTGAFPLVESLLPAPNASPTGEWQSYLYDGSNIRGTVGELVTYEGRSYRMLHLASPADPKLGISGAPIICNGQLIGIAALAYTDGSSWYAVPISDGVIKALFPSDQTAKKPPDWLDQATLDRFSDDLRQILQTAWNLSVTRRLRMVQTLDLVVALYQQKGSQLALLLAETQTDLDALLQTGGLPSSEPPAQQSEGEFKGIPPISAEVRRALNLAREKANELGPSAKIEAAHLLYGLLAVTHDNVVQALNQRGITPDKVKLPGTDQSKTAETEKKTAPTLAGYKSDDPAGTDLLDIKNEVNALASVMAAKDVEPPLSLGLFGDWGSGKSFFMRQLERRIHELQDDASTAHGKSSYCEDIVQLTFNAWTYIDADLWANLAAEIFEGLAKAVANKRGDNSQEGRALALATASSSPAIVAETERQKKEAEALLKQNQDRLAELEQSEKNMQPKLTTREVLNEAARFAVKDEDVGKRVQEAANELGLTKGAATVNDIQSQILEIDNIWTEIIFSIRNNKNLWIWLAASALVLAGGAGDTYLATHGEVVKSILGILTTVSAFLATVLAGSRKVLSFVRRIRASKENLVEKTKLAINEKIQQTRDTVERNAETVKTLNQQLENMRADRQMVDFIRQRYESSDYRQHLGVIARVRTDFQHLSVLLRDVQKESENEAEQMKTRQAQKEKERKKNDENAQPLFPRIDRIILYIDDLDRCPEKNVVEVLQAVHLLLAFPLFVVVVGVDPRWLLHSLRQHSTAFQPETNPAEEDRESREATEWESTPMNYLEKIFQIPFTLRPLGKAGFENFVDTFAAPRETKTPQPVQGAEVPVVQPAQALSAAASASSVQPGTVAPPSPVVPNAKQSVVTSPALTSASPASKPQQPEPQHASSPQPAAAPDQGQVASPTPLVDPIDRNPEHLRIEEWERTFMKALYEFIPSPRASKRFINIYRLLRASVEESERDQFVGNQKQGEYRCAQMLLAILTGYPEEACDLLGRLIETKPSCSWGELLKEYRANPQRQSAAKKSGKGTKNGKESVQSANDPEAPAVMSVEAQHWPELLAKLERLRDNNLYDSPCTGFNKWAPRVARYSFQSGRVLLRQQI